MDSKHKESLQPDLAPLDDYYNTVFDRLSSSKEPLRSAVAYALYKNAKREWIHAFRSSNGKRPTAEETKSHPITQTDSILEAYKAQADQILAEYADAIIDDERPKILKDALRGNFWTSFWPSFWASIAYTAILAALVIFAAMLGFGFPVQFTLPSHK